MKQIIIIGTKNKIKISHWQKMERQKIITSTTDFFVTGTKIKII